jgi:polysaccharide transporter, PST family
MFDRLTLLTQVFSPELRKIISNTGWLFFDRAVRMGVGLFVGVWVARYLGPEQFGVYDYALAFVLLFSTVTTLVDDVVVRDLVRYTTHSGKTLGTAFALKLLGGVASLVAIMGTIWLLRPDDRLTQVLVIIIGAGAIFQAFDAIDLWFRSRVQSKYTVYARNAAFLLVAIVKIGLIEVGAPLVAFAWAYLAELILGALGLVIVYWISGERLKLWQADFERGRALLAESWPLILSGLAIVIYMKIDVIMLREMVGAEAVGIYSAATRISEVWYFIPLAIVSSVFPSIIRVKEVSEHLYYQRLQRLFSLLVGAAFALAVPMSFLSQPIILLLFGEAYVAAGPVLAIHIWAALFVFMGVAQQSWYVNEGFTKLSLQRTVLGAAINVGLNLILIPAYSGVGAALSTVVAYAFAAFLGNAFSSRTRHIFYLQVKSLLFPKYLRG